MAGYKIVEFDFEELPPFTSEEMREGMEEPPSVTTTPEPLWELDDERPPFILEIHREQNAINWGRMHFSRSRTVRDYGLSPMVTLTLLRDAFHNCSSNMDHWD